MDIYLDNAASTRPDRRVLALVSRTDRNTYANDSASHRMGVAASLAVERARAAVAGAMNASPGEVVFTSGGTESNNLALLGAAAARGAGGHLVISAFEHSSVYNAARRLAAAGVALSEVRPGPDGVVTAGAVKKVLRRDTFLVSVMHASNETGAAQPVAEIGALCRGRGILFHTDACQSFTRLPLDVGTQALDLVSVNSHKIHGPKGAGALYVRKGLKLRPLFEGGGQEGGLRPGTRNAAGIAGFGLAACLPSRSARVAALRDLLWRELSRKIPGIRLNAAGAPRLCSILSVTLPGIRSASELLRALSAAGVCAAAGSACSSGSQAPSRALKAFGLDDAAALRTLRLSLSRFTTRDEVLKAAARIARLAREGGCGA
ncbi:MAG: cysteine desulfurase [Elusimicrobiales bacterium]|nr:cysteine desulfurase [Elusimicrobiales bacterium]